MYKLRSILTRKYITTNRQTDKNTSVKMPIQKISQKQADISAFRHKDNQNKCHTEKQAYRQKYIIIEKYLQEKCRMQNGETDISTYRQIDKRKYIQT